MSLDKRSDIIDTHHDQKRSTNIYVENFLELDSKRVDNISFTVNWSPSIDGFFSFTKQYRKIISYNMGGTHISSQKYNDKTVGTVLSVGAKDSKRSFPQRVTLTNFNLGPPITSYGCIYRYHPSNSKESEYLIVKRTDSVNYADIIRGNYRESQLFFMLQGLNNNERERLLKYNFDTLWEDLHGKDAEGDAYEYGKQTFSIISPHLKQLFGLVPSTDPTGKYLCLFPKGRPNYKQSEDRLIPESPVECSFREFEEETNGIKLIEKDILMSSPISENFLGSNSKNYQTIYFVCQTNVKTNITQFDMIETPFRQVSSGEVGNIAWIPYSKLKDFLRSDRLKLVDYVEQYSPILPDKYINPIWKNPTDTIEPFEDNDIE